MKARDLIHALQRIDPDVEILTQDCCCGYDNENELMEFVAERDDPVAGLKKGQTFWVYG